MWPNREAHHSTTSTARLYHHFPFLPSRRSQNVTCTLYTHGIIWWCTVQRVIQKSLQTVSENALLHSVRYTLPCDKKRTITKYLELWYSGLQHCVIRHLLASVSKELPASIFKVHYYPAQWGSRFLRNHNLNKRRYRNPVVLYNWNQFLYSENY
jgi:hypothetical protein